MKTFLLRIRVHFRYKEEKSRESETVSSEKDCVEILFGPKSLTDQNTVRNDQHMMDLMGLDKQESECSKWSEVKGAQSCPTLWHPIDCSLFGPLEFSRQEYRSGLPFPSPGDLPDSGITPQPPALQADPSPSEPPRKPRLHLNKGPSDLYPLITKELKGEKLTEEEHFWPHKWWFMESKWSTGCLLTPSGDSCTRGLQWSLSNWIQSKISNDRKLHGIKWLMSWVLLS